MRRLTQRADQEDTRQAITLLTERTKTELALEKERLAQRKADLDEDKKLDQQRYHDGEEDLREYLEKQRAMAFESTQVQRQELLNEYQLQRQQRTDQRDLETEQAKENVEVVKQRYEDLMAQPGANKEILGKKLEQELRPLQDKLEAIPEKYRNQELVAQAQYGTKVVGLARQLASTLLQLQEQGDKDMYASHKKSLADMEKADLEDIAKHNQIMQTQLQAGVLSPEIFEPMMRKQAAARRDTKLQDAFLEYTAPGVPRTDATMQVYLDKTEAAYKEFEEAEAKITDDSVQRRFQYYQKKQSLTEKEQGGRIDFLSGLGDTTAAQEAERQRINGLQEYIRNLTTMEADPGLQRQSDLWYRITEEIQRAQGELHKYSQELTNQQSTIGALAAIFGTLGGGISGTIQTKFGQNLGMVVSRAAASFNQTAQWSKGLSGFGRIGREETTTDASGRTTTAGAKNVQDFVAGLGAAVGALTSFVSTIEASKSAVTGMLGGGISGANIGSMFGPVGAAIGAGVGAILGGIVGNKNAQVTLRVNAFEADFRGIMQQFALNSNNLQNVISQISSLVQQIQIEKATSKKGGSQYQSLIDQYNQQLMQLQAQQEQIIIKMQEQVAVLSAPIAEQGLLGTIQQIIETYAQFSGAAKNATDLANANYYLVQSLQAYEQNLATQLLQDNQQAIQDAVQLNDLIYQRQAAVLSYNNTVQGILSQGVLTRQMTRAQTAGEQIQAANVQYQRQMEQLNEEIAAATYKVQAESTIFTLATTRIGLETQLLTLQNAQTNLSMQQIQALQNLVAQLASGNLAGGALGQLLASIPSVTNPAIGLGTPTNALQALMGLGEALTNQQTLQLLELLFAGAYQDRASAGYGAFQAQGL